MLCDDEIEEFLVAFTVEKGKKKRACIKQTLFFDLTQPVRVATNKISRYVVPLQFQSNATRAGCNRLRRFRLCHRENFNLTQPVRVATLIFFVVQQDWKIFQSNATRAGCNSKLAQTKQ